MFTRFTAIKHTTVSTFFGGILEIKQGETFDIPLGQVQHSAEFLEAAGYRFNRNDWQMTNYLPN